MPEITESQFFKGFDAYLNKSGHGRIVRIAPNGEPGVPDSIIKLTDYDTPFLLEVKIGSDVIRRSQIRMLKKIPFYVVSVPEDHSKPTCQLYPGKVRDEVAIRIEFLVNYYMSQV